MENDLRPLQFPWALQSILSFSPLIWFYSPPLCHFWHCSYHSAGCMNEQPFANVFSTTTSQCMSISLFLTTCSAVPKWPKINLKVLVTIFRHFARGKLFVLAYFLTHIVMGLTVWKHFFLEKWVICFYFDKNEITAKWEWLVCTLVTESRSFTLIVVGTVYKNGP